MSRLPAHHLELISYTGPDTNFLNLIFHEQAAPADLAKDTKLVATLGEISSETGLLPNSVGSLQGLENREEIAVATGGTTDIWSGTLSGKQVAFKAFRIYRDLQEAKKILWKLVPIWKRLIHENVLPFHGVDMSIFELALVYDWCDNGNIIQYLESHSDVSRPKLVAVLPVPCAFDILNDLSSCYKSPKDSNISTLSMSSTGT